MSSEIPGVAFVSLQFFRDDGTAFLRDHYLFKMDEITGATLMRGRGAGKIYPGGVMDEIPLGNFSDWLYNTTWFVDGKLKPKPGYWPDPGRKADHYYRVKFLVEAFRDCELNREYVDAISFTFEGGGTISTKMPDWAWNAGAPVGLYLPADGPIDLTQFHAWYGRELENYTRRLVADEVGALRWQLGAKVAELQEALDARAEVREKLLPTMEKFQTGSLIFDICEDFARPKAEREAMWGTWKYKGRHYVVPEPDADRRERFAKLRKEWETQLLKPCAASMNSTHSRKAIDKAALAVVDELRREDAAYFELLDRYDGLHPGSKAELLGTIKDAFRLALLSEPARNKLLAGELASLGNAAADAAVGDALGLVGADLVHTALRDAIDRYPDVKFSPEPTPYGKKVVKNFGDIKTAYEKAGLGVEILGLAAPYIATRIRQRSGGGPEGQINAVGYLWRCLVGTTKVNGSPLKALQNFLTDLRRDPSSDAPDKWRLFEHDKGPLSGAYEMGDQFFKFGTLMTQLVSVHYVAWEQGSERPSPAKQLEAMKAVADTMKAFTDLVPEAYSSGRLLHWTVDRVDDGGTLVFARVPNMFQVISLVADAIALATAIATWKESKHSLKSNKSKAFRDMAFDVFSAVASMVGVVVGAEFILVGLLVFSVKSVIDNWDWIVAHEPGLEYKPGPHIFLETMLEDMDKPEFVQLLDEIGDHDTYYIFKGWKRVQAKLEKNIPTGGEMLWDIGGAPGEHANVDARNWLKTHYGFSAEAADMIARTSREDPE